MLYLKRTNICVESEAGKRLLLSTVEKFQYTKYIIISFFLQVFKLDERGLSETNPQCTFYKVLESIFGQPSDDDVHLWKYIFIENLFPINFSYEAR